MGKLYVYGVKGYMEVLYFLYKPKTALKNKVCQKTVAVPYAEEFTEKQDLTHCCWEFKVIMTFWEIGWQFLKKLNV